MFPITQSSSITGASPSDSLMSYQDTRWGSLTHPQRCNCCILLPQPTRPENQWRQQILTIRGMWQLFPIKLLIVPSIISAVWDFALSWWIPTTTNLRNDIVFMHNFECYTHKSPCNSEMSCKSFIWGNVSINWSTSSGVLARCYNCSFWILFRSSLNNLAYS